MRHHVASCALGAACGPAGSPSPSKNQRSNRTRLRGEIAALTAPPARRARTSASRRSCNGSRNQRLRVKPASSERLLAARGETPASHRGRRGAPLLHPTAHSPRRGGPGGAARRPQSGVPTVRVVHGGVQYREYLRKEQRSQRGCIAGRMQAEFHHGLLGS
jgi:hypothetical protein